MAQPPPCPNCGFTAYQLADDRWLVCTNCDYEFDLQRDLCRKCGHLNSATDKICYQCQAPLSQDKVSQLIAERSRDRLSWREERTMIAQEQKVQEKKASQRRMEAYWAEEKARREAVARSLAEQREKERRLMIAIAIITVTILLAGGIVAIAIAIFKNRGTPASMKETWQTATWMLALCRTQISLSVIRYINQIARV